MAGQSHVTFSTTTVQKFKSLKLPSICASELIVEFCDKSRVRNREECKTVTGGGRGITGYIRVRYPRTISRLMAHHRIGRKIRLERMETRERSAGQRYLHNFLSAAQGRLSHFQLWRDHRPDADDTNGHENAVPPALPCPPPSLPTPLRLLFVRSARRFTAQPGSVRAQLLPVTPIQEVPLQRTPNPALSFLFLHSLKSVGIWPT